jgi:hypothetical protein
MKLRIFVDPKSSTSQIVMEELNRQFGSLDAITTKTQKARPPVNTLTVGQADIASILLAFGPPSLLVLKALLDIIKESLKSKGGQKDPPIVVIVVEGKPDYKILIPSATPNDEKVFLETVSKIKED